MKRYFTIGIFLLVILIINIFTYIRIGNSENQTETTTEASRTSATKTMETTTSTTTESVTIETITKKIDDGYSFKPYSTSDTVPEKYLKDVTNFDHITDPSLIQFDNGINYPQVPGILTFRGNNFRRMASYGSVEVKEAQLEAVWSFDIGNLDVWTGVGWTGQPLIIKWPDDIKKIMNIKDEKRSKPDLKEVIYATLDGNIYFLDLEDGKKTREPINVGAPHKGTPSLDPRGYPLLYAGQGINLVHEQRIPLGFRIFSLIDQSLLYFLDGNDPEMKRNWFAFDSSPIIDAQNDTCYEPGESGIFYKIELNTEFSIEDASIKIEPEVSRYRYDPVYNDRPGIENSMVTYMNYGFFADNSGFIQCIDLNTLEPVWANYLKEDTDSSIVAEEINGRLYLYVGSEVDFQGTSGKAYIRKIDGLTGEFIWEIEYLCASTETVNGGVLATPAIGTGDLEDHIFFNVAMIDGTNRSLLVALDKNTGREIWRYIHNNYSWSSPIFIHSENDTYHIVQCDSIGQVILFDAKLGQVQDVLDLGINIEGSPVIYDDMMVVGTRGQKIWGFRIY